MKLVKVIYIGRHGERSPLRMPVEFKKEWGGNGILTPKGAETQYKKGAFLREKYADLFKRITETNIFCQTSNMDRTIDSCFSLLRGLLAQPFALPSTLTKLEKVTLLRKYGAKIKPLTSDVLYRGFYGDLSPNAKIELCKLFEDATEKRMHFPELLPFIPKAHITIGLSADVIMDYWGMFYLFDMLQCYKANEKPFPKDFEDGEVHKKIEFIHYFILNNLMFASETVRRLANHYIMRQICEIINGPDNEAFYYYLSHDSNIFALILGLGHNIGEIPPCSSGITFEIYVDSTNGQKFISIDYNGKNLNKILFPDIKTDLIPDKVLCEKMAKECFKCDEEYRDASGNKAFDYIKDYVNAPEIQMEHTQETESKQLNTLLFDPKKPTN